MLLRRCHVGFSFFILKWGLLTCYTISLGLPKRFEEFIFFDITHIAAFKAGLAQLIPQLTSTDDVLNFRKRIYDHKKQNHPGLIKLIGINIAFSFRALAKVCLHSVKFSWKF